MTRVFTCAQYAALPEWDESHGTLIPINRPFLRVGTAEYVLNKMSADGRTKVHALYLWSVTQSNWQIRGCTVTDNDDRVLI